MLKRIPISFILIIFIYQLCCYLKLRNQIIPEIDEEIYDKKNQEIDDNKNNNLNNNSNNNDLNNNNNDLNNNNNDLNNNNNDLNNNDLNNKNDNLTNKKQKNIKFNYDNNLESTNIFKDFYYGEPHKTLMSKNGPIYLWKFKNPEPWSKIVYIPGNEFNYEFSFIAKVPSLDHYQSWKKIIPNIHFNPNTEEITIPSNDEEGALSVANLIINNFKNKISINDIIKKNLINISISKCKKFPIVKKKIKEQINDLINNNDENKFRREADYEEDLAKAKKQQETFGPSGYGGNEYSYL